MISLSDHLADGRVTLTLSETAEILGVHRQTVSAAAERGEIPSVKYGRRRLVLVEPLARQLGVSAPADRSMTDEPAGDDGTVAAADHRLRQRARMGWRP